MLKNKTIGFYIAFFSGAAAVVASIAYLAIYMATAAETVDRVFSWFTFGFMLAGGLIATAGELTRMKWIPLASCACFSLALANHAVEFAYHLKRILHLMIIDDGVHRNMNLGSKLMGILAELLDIIERIARSCSGTKLWRTDIHGICTMIDGGYATLQILSWGQKL